MIDVLANAADPQISGEWVIRLIGAIFAGAALIAGRYWGRKEKASENSVTIKDQPIRVTKDQRPVSYDQYTALDARVGRMEAHLDAIQRDQGMQYKQILEAGAERELRMTEFFGLGLREVHARLDKLMELKANPPRR